jgi:hypothetical protein
MNRRTLWIVLLCVFAAIIGGTYGYINAQDHYVVVVHNDSPHNLENFRVFGAGCDEHFDPILPGETIKRSFVIAQDGKLELTGNGDTPNGVATYDKVIDERVEKGREGMATVSIDQDGDLSAITEKGN